MGGRWHCSGCRPSTWSCCMNLLFIVFTNHLSINFLLLSPLVFNFNSRALLSCCARKTKNQSWSCSMLPGVVTARKWSPTMCQLLKKSRVKAYWQLLTSIDLKILLFESITISQGSQLLFTSSQYLIFYYSNLRSWIDRLTVFFFFFKIEMV